MIYLVIHIKHGLYRLLAKHDFSCSLEHNDLKKWLE